MEMISIFKLTIMKQREFLENVKVFHLIYISVNQDNIILRWKSGREEIVKLESNCNNNNYKDYKFMSKDDFNNVFSLLEQQKLVKQWNEEDGFHEIDTKNRIIKL